jgi:hypothetical protein
LGKKRDLLIPSDQTLLQAAGYRSFIQPTARSIARYGISAHPYYPLPLVRACPGGAARRIRTDPFMELCL